MVESPPALVVQWVAVSIHQGGPIELFSRSSQWSTTDVTQCCVLFCLWDGAHKISLAANRKEKSIKWRWISFLTLNMTEK